MAEEKTYTLTEAHLHFAKSLNGRVWDLLEKPERTPREDEIMLLTAYASCYHWIQVGTAVNQQRGEWLIARVYTVLGRKEMALQRARRCFELTEQFDKEMEDFDRAYAYESLARAHALAGETGFAKHYYELAQKAGEAIKNEEDRKIFMNDIVSGNWYDLKVDQIAGAR
ncbi:MAG: hypothetical protein ABSA51_06700 [Anaerolineaceae bacterium]|jgi:hypothetical protein